MAGDEVVEARLELEAATRAAGAGAEHFGLQGATLQRYCSQLAVKEKLLRQRQVYLSFASGNPEVLVHLQSQGLLAQPAVEAKVAPVFPAEPAAQSASQSASQSAASSRPVPREPPAGETKAFDSKDCAAVLAHLCDYEAVPLESARALRALSRLAYTDAAFNVEDSRVLGQVLRLMAIHRDEPQVMLHCMRVLSNAAFDPDTAIQRLTDPVLSVGILQAMAGSATCKDLSAMASEAAARIVAAEVCVPGETPSDGGPPRTVRLEDVKGLGALAGFFSAAIGKDDVCQRSALLLATQLLANEVVSPATIAQRFAAAAPLADGPQAAFAWLGLAQQLAPPSELRELGEALVEVGCLRLAAELMGRFPRDAAVQQRGVESMSALIGDRLSGLHAFAEVEGCKVISAAVQANPGVAILQAKGIKALACSIRWPEDLQKKAGFVHSEAIELTKDVMVQNAANADVQIEGLAALAQYLERPGADDDVDERGGTGLVKAMMARHMGVERVQKWGNVVLERLGGKQAWAPRPAAVPAASPES